jgi:hypothetical protein
MKKTLVFKNPKKRIAVLFMMLTLASGLYAQTTFPGSDYWSLDAGFGMTGIFVEGRSYQGIFDPKLWLSPPLMIGSRLGIGYSTDSILSFEGQVYLRWNFLRRGFAKKPVNVFIQSGLGMVAAYRGTDTPFSDATQNRGSLIADAALGITIPLSSRWHIEPTIRGGYPHIAGFGVTTGYKIPWSQKTKSRSRSRNETIRNMLIATVEHIMFGPDIGQYNAGINRETQRQNELILNNLAQMLVANPDLRLRIEGHANPVTYAHGEAERLMSLSKVRADTIAGLLMEKGVSEDQMIIIAFGGARTIASDYDVRNRNRRVELIVIQVDA